MEWITDFLNSEKALYLFAGIVGFISVVVGLLFLLFSNHKSFAVTMIVIGVLEMAVMFPAYLKYQQKIEEKISVYKSNEKDFLETESLKTQSALKSFFWLKLVYGILIIVFILIMSRLSSSSILFGIFTALIIHFAVAITIDNFGEKFTKLYLTELRKDL
jgi:glucan phosphoethanolaminetransferase (alkaline phosphatase superfamily)